MGECECDAGECECDMSEREWVWDGVSGMRVSESEYE